MTRKLLGDARTYAAVALLAAVATWQTGGVAGMLGAGLALVTGSVLLCGWILLGRAMSRTSQDAKREKSGAVMSVMAFLLKVPAIGFAAVLANRMSPPGPASFAAWIVLVYSGAVVWSVCRRPSQ